MGDLIEDLQPPQASLSIPQPPFFLLLSPFPGFSLQAALPSTQLHRVVGDFTRAQTLTALSGHPTKPWHRRIVNRFAATTPPGPPPKTKYTPMSTSSTPRSTGTTRPSPSNGGSKTNSEAKICEGSMGRARLPPPLPLRRSMGRRNPLHNFTKSNPSTSKSRPKLSFEQ